MRKGVPSNQIKALAMAMAGAAVAAVATMFVPTHMLEGFTGATGLSELVPAAAAPLGDTARAMIAFAAGAFTLAVLSYIALRKETPPGTAAPALLDEAQQAETFKDRLARIALPKMPWHKGDDDITELADLPRLRNNDTHPDAPPRRPLSARQDLPVLDLAEITGAVPGAKEIAATETAEVAAAAIAVHDAADEATPVSAPPVPASVILPTDIQPTLAEMVAQLESAVAERQKQLAELEGVAARFGTGSAITEKFSPGPVEIESSSPRLAQTERPSLQAVQPSVKDDDMDSALTAALATLHRMNGTNS